MGAGVEVTVSMLQKQLGAAVAYLKPFIPMTNCHMTRFLSENLWQRSVSDGIQTEIRTPADVDEAITIYKQHLNPTANINADFDRFKNFRSFLLNTKQYYLDRYTDVWITPDDLNRKLNLGIGDKKKKSEGLMGGKKQYEVEAVADVIAKLCALNQKDEKLCVIDAGDGKGYLSSHLSIAYGIKVLGIDSKCARTASASERYKYLLNPPKKLRKDNTIGLRQLSLDEMNYRNTTHYITPQTDFVGLFSENFMRSREDIPGFCLTGLHTCGDLASTCLKVFRESNQISAICNIGCCYHLNSQRFDDTNQFNFNPALDSHRPLVGYGFPLSRYMYENQFGVGASARQLSAESVHRTVNLTNDAEQYRKLYYRALLEVLIQRKCPQFYGITVTGQIRNENFIDYVRKANERNLHLNFDESNICDDELEDLHEEFGKYLPFMCLYQRMRASLGSIIETIFVLDRLLYLKENEQCQNDVSYLVKFFDPIRSPRCYGLVAIKNYRSVY